MSTPSKLVNLFFMLVLTSIAGLIIFRTVKAAGIILYTFHPVFMAIGVSLSLSFESCAISDRFLVVFDSDDAWNPRDG